jgi:predicted nucleic acid-binding protein
VTYLLDTNVVSEWMKPHPDPGVIEWLDEVDEDRVFLSVVSLAELRYGIERLPVGRRRARLDEWLHDQLPARFEGRVLSIDDRVADLWGQFVARREAVGRPIAAMDALIAATAELHELTLVTRNLADFEGAVAALLSPWHPG